MNLVQENDKAILWQLETGEYEVWMKLYFTVGPRKGELIEPKDEDFGVSAWIAYGLKGAMRIYDEITTGKRNIRPMTEQGEF